MKAIKLRVCFLAAATGIGIAAAAVAIFSQYAFTLGAYKQLLLTVLLIITGLLGGLTVREYKRYKTAELIIENQLLHIRLANRICDKVGTSSPSQVKESHISCFGILQDSKIIKFNQDGVYLKSVEMGREFIILTYGTDMWLQKTHFFYEPLDSQELAEIVARFHYETGVLPVITENSC